MLARIPFTTPTLTYQGKTIPCNADEFCREAEQRWRDATPEQRERAAERLACALGELAVFAAGGRR